MDSQQEFESLLLEIEEQTDEINRFKAIEAEILSACKGLTRVQVPPRLFEALGKLDVEDKL